MVLNNLLDLGFKLRGDDTSSNLLEKGSLRSGEMFTELSFPLGDLVDSNGIQL
jgi:hypothetical protein